MLVLVLMLMHAYASSIFSRHNLSLALSKFIGIELHGEESSVAFSRFISVELDSEASIMSTRTEYEFWGALACVQIWNALYPIFGIWPHISKQTYTPSCNAVPLAWGLIRLVPIINHLISRISLVPKLSGAWEWGYSRIYWHWCCPIIAISSQFW